MVVALLVPDATILVALNNRAWDWDATDLKLVLGLAVALCVALKTSHFCVHLCAPCG